MRLVLFFDHRFQVDGLGNVFSPVAYNYELFANRYLSVFDEICIVARIQACERCESECRRADGPGVRIVSAGSWSGAMGYVASFGSRRRFVKATLAANTAVMCVAPGGLGSLACREIEEGRPYGLEVVGDPYEVFAAGRIEHPARRFIRLMMTRELRNQCMGASTIAYVNSTVLPQRYPAKKALFDTVYSSLEMAEEDIALSPRSYSDVGERLRLITVGSLEVPYKGIDNLLDAFALIVRRFPEATLTIVGDGALRSTLQRQAARLEIDQRVLFTGRLPAGSAVREKLDQSDLFVLASRTEGMPRAMIEAMARGLPCVGTAVGGIPELLGEEYMVPVDSSEQLAAKLIQVMSDPQQLLAMSATNLETARRFRSEVLQGRRVAHYRALREVTNQWIISARRTRSLT